MDMSEMTNRKRLKHAMIYRADRCLYEAKRTGRNRVIAYSEIREFESWK